MDAGSSTIPDRISVMAYEPDRSHSGARTENIAHDSFWSTLGATDGVVCGDHS
jgi:hypothetical protein